jgi:hypothetical protein
MLAVCGDLVALGLRADLGALILVVFLGPGDVSHPPVREVRGDRAGGRAGRLLQGPGPRRRGAALALLARLRDGLAPRVSRPLL